MRTTMGVGAVLALLGASGCYVGDWDSGSSWSEGRAPVAPDEGRPGGWEDPGTGDELVVVDAHLSGSLGAVRGFSEEPYRVTAYRYGGTDVIRVDATDSVTGQWVMSEVYVEGGVDHPSLLEGEEWSFDEEDRGVSTGAVFVSGLGCSGPAEMEFDYDEATQRVDGQVQAGSSPGQRIYEFQLVFRDGSVADLRVEVVMPGVESAPEPTLQGAHLSGSLDGIHVDGAATWLEGWHGAAGSTVTLEHETAEGAVLRARVDVNGDGGLGGLVPGSYTLPPVGGEISLAASTVPFEIDPGYDRQPTFLEAHVEETGSGRELILVARFGTDEELTSVIRYDTP